MPPTRTRRSPLLEAPTRPHYFDGRFLTARDLAQEQEYHIGARRRLTLLALGSGVVTGLGVSRGDGSVVVSPGLAIDRFGREIIVPGSVELPLGAGSGVRALVLLAYAEELIEPMPVAGTSGTGTDTIEHGSVRETYRVWLSSEAPAADDPDGTLVIGKLPGRRAKGPRTVTRKRTSRRG